MDARIEGYISYLNNEQKSTNTVESYRIDLIQFEEYAAGRDLTILTAEEVNGFKGWMADQGIGALSQARKLAAVRGLYNWLVDYRGLVVNPAARVKSPKVHSNPIRIMTQEQVGAFLKKVSDARDRAVLTAIYSTGCRVSEVHDINVTDLNGNEVLVRGKGGKVRPVVLGPNTIKTVNAYLEVRKDLAGCNNPALFLSREGQRLSVRSIQQVMKNWVVACAPGAASNPHNLRHAHASHWHENGASLAEIRDDMGHASISTTDRYIHLTQNHGEGWTKAMPAAA